VTQATLSQLYHWDDVLLYELGFTLLILLGVCGALIALRWARGVDKRAGGGWARRMTFLSAAALVTTPIPYLLAIVSPDMMPDRWFVYITVLLGVFSAFTLYVVARLSRAGALAALVAVPLIVFFMATSPISNPNDHIYLKEMATRPTLTMPEFAATVFLGDHVNTSLVYANSLVAGRVDYQLHTLEHFIDPRKPLYYDIMLIRTTDLVDGFYIPLYGSGGKLLEIVRPSAAFSGYVDRAGRFYDNGEVEAVFGAGWPDCLAANSGGGRRGGTLEE
jgi:hypothetical protein